MLKLPLVFTLFFLASPAQSAESNTCQLLAEQSLLIDYSELQKNNQLEAMGIKLNTTGKSEDSSPPIFRLVRGARNSSKVFSANHLLKKGEIHIGIPLERNELFGYRIQLEYKTIKGMKVGEQVVENIAILTKIELISPEGFDTTIASLPSGGPAISDVLFTLRKSEGQIKPISIRKILTQEAKRLQKMVDAKPALEEAIKPAIKDLNAAIGAKDIPTLKDLADALAKARYNMSESPIPKEDVVLDIATVISGKMLKKFTEFSYDFFFNPSKNLDAGRTQDQLKDFESEKDFDAYWKQIKSENFKNWIVDRTKRQIGNAPAATIIGLIAGVISSYLAYSYGVTDDEKLEKSIDKNSVKKDGTITNNNGKAYVIEGLHNNSKVELNIREEKAGEYSLVPVDKKMKFKKDDQLLIKGTGNKKLKIEMNPDIVEANRIPL